jgi:CRP-like cAMP-binding protein
MPSPSGADVVVFSGRDALVEREKQGSTRSHARGLRLMASIELLRNDPSAKAVVAGDTIFSIGDPGDVAYVVTEGEIELSINGRTIETVGSGGIFGEMALIDRLARSATAKAGTDAKVVPIDQRRFLYLIQNTPFFAVEVMQVMADRIRRMDARV